VRAAVSRCKFHAQLLATVSRHPHANRRMLSGLPRPVCRPLATDCVGFPTVECPKRPARTARRLVSGEAPRTDVAPARAPSIRGSA
jgi:hypothetical protein